MRRKIYDELLQWKKKSAGEVALMIDGARRVGKSYILKEFAEREYKSSIIIDFNSASKELVALFDNHLDDLDTFFVYLSAYYGTKLYPGESLIAFDEVQLYPKARAAIKYLVADGRYHYIETGSLASVNSNVKDIVLPSEERHLLMYPMDFEEFLWAMGNENMMEIIRLAFDQLKPMGQALHRKAMNYFRQYLIVGGMPQAVEKYISTQDFNQVDLVKRDILNLYRGDITKYAAGAELKTKAIFDEIPSQLQKHDKVFRIAALTKQAKRRDYEDAIFWLQDSMIVNNCYNSVAPSVGLNLNTDRLRMKTFMGDTGLLLSHTFDEKGLMAGEIYKRILFDKLDFNQGMIMENIVAQMLVAAGHKLYFYQNSDRENVDKRMEIDFLVTKRDVTDRHNIWAIEVKSGKRYTLNSLNKFRKKFVGQLYKPCVLHTLDVREEDGITYLPLYMTGLL